MQEDDSHDFWKPITARDELESRRQEQREQWAAGWKRNLLAVLLALLALCGLMYVMP